jgi:hypothetical protein
MLVGFEKKFPQKWVFLIQFSIETIFEESFGVVTSS